ncbi:MAG: tetratricopeptide repeat protein [Candidatus Riflebacteria bacterium]|nr:tetratricopeptide repeat protein [Candidatus Riflebacteria bacterium]
MEEIRSYFSPELVDEMIEKLVSLSSVNPENPRIFINLGKAYQKKGLYDSALSSFNKALRIDGRNTSLLLMVGKCHLVMKEYQAAVEAFQRASEAEPGWTDIHFLLAKSFRELNQGTNAKKALDAALAINPNFLHALTLMSELLEDEDDYKSALEFLKRALKTVSPDKPIFDAFPYELDVLYDNPVLLDEAIRQMDAFLNTHSGYADLHFKLGMAYKKKNMKSEALSCFKKALKINPKFHLARHHYWNWDDDKLE